MHFHLPNKNLLILFLCQTLFWIMTITGITLASLVGLQLAPRESLATLPVAVLTLGAILTTYPLSAIMQRYGRRTGFSLGGLAAFAGGALAWYGIVQQSFWLFCASSLLLGTAQASAMYYRLAAADSVDKKSLGSAIAWVMSGGIVAALVAPTIALWSKDLLLPDLYAGSYMMVSLLGLAILMLCLNLGLPGNTPRQNKVGGRPLSEILRQPIFIAALCNIAIGNGVMILIMVSTPLAVIACGYPLGDAASIIQWHVLGMFLPSFFSGKWVDRWGANTIALLGAALLLVSSAIAMAGIQLANFYGSLFLLGMGWNFIYTAGSSMLTASHKPEERGRVQGLAELIASAIAAFAAFSSGPLLSSWGWASVHIAAAPLLGFVLVITYWFSRQAAAEPA